MPCLNRKRGTSKIVHSSYLLLRRPLITALITSAAVSLVRMLALRTVLLVFIQAFRSGTGAAGCS